MQEWNRKVFEYFNGVQNVFGDPMAISRKMAHAAGAPVEQVLAQAQSEDANIKAAAQDLLVRAVRYAFDMAPFDVTTGDGATEEDVINAYRAYCTYLDKKKHSTVERPSSSMPSTVTLPPDSIVLDYPSTTRPSSASGVTSG